LKELSEALYKLPLTRAHNKVARERISQEISQLANPAYKKFVESRQRPTHQSIESDSRQELQDRFWSVGHHLRLVQQEQILREQQKESGTGKGTVKANKMKVVLNSDQSLGRNDMIQAVYKSSNFLRKNKDRYKDDVAEHVQSQMHHIYEKLEPMRQLHAKKKAILESVRESPILAVA
jgi:hypothetical protein